jgi:hypothetical protein
MIGDVLRHFQLAAVLEVGVMPVARLRKISAKNRAR